VEGNLTKNFAAVEGNFAEIFVGVEENIKELNEKMIGVDSKLEELLKILAK
jgi:hydroxyethylthiazole kinase-like sugar kinase family protein